MSQKAFDLYGWNYAARPFRACCLMKHPQRLLS